MFPTVSDQCWRCERERGTFLHIWWTCTLIQPYWEKVHEVTKAISLLPLEFTPVQYHLHHSKISQKKYYKSVAMHMINAARLCIPVQWRSKVPPSIKSWVMQINRIVSMEELIYTSQDKISIFSAIWEAWFSLKKISTISSTDAK